MVRKKGAFQVRTWYEIIYMTTICFDVVLFFYSYEEQHDLKHETPENESEMKKRRKICMKGETCGFFMSFLFMSIVDYFFVCFSFQRLVWGSCSAFQRTRQSAHFIKMFSFRMLNVLHVICQPLLSFCCNFLSLLPPLICKKNVSHHRSSYTWL